MSTLVQTIDPVRVRELMVERGLDVPALAAATGLTAKTCYSVLAGAAVSLATAGKIFRALGPGDRTGFFTIAAQAAPEPDRVPAGAA